MSSIDAAQKLQDWASGWERFMRYIDVQKWLGTQQGRLEETVPQLVVFSDVFRPVRNHVNRFFELDEIVIVLVRCSQHDIQALNGRHRLIERVVTIHVRSQTAHVQYGGLLHFNGKFSFAPISADLYVLLILVGFQAPCRVGIFVPIERESMVREQLPGELGKGQALPLARGWRGDVHVVVVCLGNDAIQQQLDVVDFD